jgi:hypothetical protein
MTTVELSHLLEQLPFNINKAGIFCIVELIFLFFARANKEELLNVCKYFISMKILTVAK